MAFKCLEQLYCVCYVIWDLVISSNNEKDQDAFAVTLFRVWLSKKVKKFCYKLIRIWRLNLSQWKKLTISI